ncbi:hypothetical protein DNTS_017775 [Danionella cerebrum]|uniref:Metalloendopeptidase n=1 Tax=Danionella cerebrum TaxID=2873325 RepID=A0A553RHZ2_9TELE|nr:hypothetical protein DNTS_017775 [Danionella translucida]
MKRNMDLRDFSILLLLVGISLASPLKDLGVEDVSVPEPDTIDMTTKILETNKGSSEILIEGDLLLPKTRNALICLNNGCFWKKNASNIVEVPYVVSNDFAFYDKAVIANAMSNFHAKTCVRFVPRTSQTDFLSIENLDGCYSSLGRTGGKQVVSLNRLGCVYTGIVQHELNHALGFYHEHTRSDRDQYVYINWDNISPDMAYNFQLEHTNNQNTAYDYGSVMHYGNTAFAVQPGLETIIPIPDPNVPIGQRQGLSHVDVQRINKLDFSILLLLVGISLASPLKDLGVEDVSVPEPETIDMTTMILETNKGSSEILIEGDLLLPKTRNALICLNNGCFWKKNASNIVEVPYVVSNDFGYFDKAVIANAMSNFHAKTCVRFVPRTSQTDFLSIENLDGCYSSLGRTGGKQVVSLNRLGCVYTGIVQHEFNHALGFYHEHTRSDRDQYVRINWDNISPDMAFNFQLQHTNNQNTSYDYGSVMHYGNTAFAVQPGLETITPIPNPYVPIGQRQGLSGIDVQRINKLDFSILLLLVGISLASPLKDLGVEDVSVPEPETIDMTTMILETNKGSSEILIEGDLLLPKTRNALICLNNGCFWKKNANNIVEVPYVVSNDFGYYEKAVIGNAMSNFHAKTCVRFVPRTSQTDFLSIENLDGCYSSLGRTGGKQVVSFNRLGCVYTGIIQHELNHALGFYHEHTRSDRDQYVRINWNNISPDMAYNFKLEHTNNQNTAYDYGSVMHYGNTAFAVRPGLETITPIPNPYVPIGQRQGLSSIDDLGVEDVSVPEPETIDMTTMILETNKGSSEILIEGDLLLPKTRNALICLNNGCFWKKNANNIVEVPYVVSNDFGYYEKAVIGNAMSNFHAKTCVRFVPRTSQTDFLRRTGGKQVVSFNRLGCVYTGIIQHELNHALGFYHEHTRSDRDQYVRINWNNISPDMAYNFKLEHTNNQNTAYDYGSVMHYGNTAFAVRPGLETITPIPNPYVPIGQRQGLSSIDDLGVEDVSVPEPETIDMTTMILETNKGSSEILIEGDLLLPKTRNALICLNNGCFWKKNASNIVEVPYVVSNDFAFFDKAVIANAMSNFHAKTCVRFVPRTSQTDFLSIENLDGCYSSLGRTGGKQVVSLSRAGCVYTGIVQHELNHALGFYHEHTRSDRDQYVRINWDNISPDMAYNFELEHTNNQNTSYDYSSDLGVEDVSVPEPETIDMTTMILETNKGSSEILIEGDLLLPKTRNALICLNNGCFWKKNANNIVEVPYVVSNDFAFFDKAVIANAMSNFHAKTCVRFVPRTSQTDFLSIENLDGCYSSLGRTGGKQVVSLSRAGCVYTGIVQHELNHALGFYHEHTRSDRDQYVRINWDNISPDMAYNFELEHTNNQNTSYDYSSVMHYGKTAFAVRPGLETITPIPNPYVPIGQRQGLSGIDVQRINKLLKSDLVFYINGKKITEKNADPEEMLLGYLRRKVGLTGTKYGCGGGGCGACTVMLSRYDPLQNTVLHCSVNACLQPICSLHGVAVVTIEGIGSTKTKLHPVQERIAKAHGSQCGFCTPGMAMSMYALLRNNPHPSIEDIREALGGNLCRCTGYRPIIDGFKTFCDAPICGQNGDGNGKCCMENHDSQKDCDKSEELFSMKDALPLDPTQDLIFPPELMILGRNKGERISFVGEKMRWISPADLKDLIKLKAEYPNATLLVGNTTLGPKMNLKGMVFPLVIYGGNIPELQAIKWRKNGAGCSLSVLKDNLLQGIEKLGSEQSRIYRVLVQTLQCLAGKQIRNMATIGGNILSANPKYDLCSWEFVSAFRQAQRREFAFSIVNAGMKVVFKQDTNVVEQLDLFYGGLENTLVKARHTCKVLAGKLWDEKLLGEATELLEEEMRVSPAAPGGREEYRKALVLSFFFKFYMQVLLELQQKDVAAHYLPLEYLSALKPFENEVPRGNHSFQLVPETQSFSDPVGRPRAHQAALQQATGEAVFYDDIPSVKGEFSIDASVSLEMPGVAAFISAKDVPGQNRRLWFNNPEELFAEEEVICVGQIIGAIVAETREQAKRASEQVSITYQDIKPVFFTIEEAIEHQSFFDPKRKLERGNVDEAFAEADHILEGEMYMGGQEHFYMETQGLIAIPKGEAGEMELFVASQHAAFTQEVVGITLGIDSNKITCHVKRLGGGFGGKVMKIASLSAIAATAAQKLGRAVRCVLERGDDMLITSGRSPFLGKYKVGYMNDGTILAADITYYSNGGCTLDESSFIMEKALLHMDNGYKIPHLRGRGLVCKTYLPSYTAFRGFGGPQGLTIIESVLHEVAVKSGLPASQVRDINMYKGEKCYTHHNQLFSPDQMVRCWNECLGKSSYNQRSLSIEQFNAHNHWKKRGISIVPLKFGVGFSKGFYNQGAALVNIYKDGSVLISHGGTEMGQGINTKATQIASRILKVPMSLIHVKETCTGNVPNAAPSAASFGTDAVGMAVKNGCEKLMKRLEPLVQKHPHCTWQQLVVEAYCQKISLSATGFFLGPHTSVDWEKSEGNAYYYFTFGACCSEVEIDCLTGDHKNIRTDIVMDVGRSINPALDVGQVEGGFVQGLGLYTIEELQFSPEGVLLTRGPSQYKIPALCDIPSEINVHLLRNADNPHAIYSSKGIGEPPVFFGCTLFFAIKEAITAARKERGLSESFSFSSPATAEKIRMACEDCFTRIDSKEKKIEDKPWAINKHYIQRLESGLTLYSPFRQSSSTSLQHAPYVK